MATAEKNIKVEQRFLYIKCAKNIGFKKFGKTMVTLPGGTVYRICVPVIMDYLVDSTLTLEYDMSDNVEVLQSEYCFETMPMGLSFGSGGGGGGSVTVDLAEVLAKMDSIILNDTTSIGHLDTINTAVGNTDASVTEIKTNVGMVKDSTATISTDVSTSKNTLSGIATELSKFHADFNQKSGGGAEPVSMMATNGTLQDILGGVNQLQKIAINVPKKFDMVLASSSETSLDIVAFDTLLPQDVNLCYSLTKIEPTVPSNTVRLKFLGGIVTQGSYSITYGINGKGMQQSITASTEGDMIVFTASEPVTSLDWLNLVGVPQA